MRTTFCAALAAAAMLSACTQNDRPARASSEPKTKPQTYSRDPFPSTYRVYPGTVTGDSW